MIVFLIVLGIILVICIWFSEHVKPLEAEWLTATSMTKKSVKEVAYGTYEDFLKNLFTVEWTRNEKFPESYFSESVEDQYYNRVHASIFIFKGTGMIFNYNNYCKVHKYLEDHALPIVVVDKTSEPVATIIEKEW